ncbi:MAG TPA: hypothetical protein PLZ51_17090, partial [Aggregatilineales bacterium]|nr:hypothetical protein [Aggregatilineales bacterium]
EYSSHPILPTFSWKYKISFSPDSSKLLIALSNNTVQIWDIQTRQMIGNIDDFTNKTVQIAFQNTNELVAYGINGNKEHVISGTEIQTRQIQYPSGTSMSDAILSPDGDSLIYLLRTIDSLNGIYSYNIGTHETQELYLGKDNIDLVELKRNLLAIARDYRNIEPALEIWDLSQGMVISSISTNFPRKGIFSD